MGLDRQLLAERQLNDRLLWSATEESKDAPEDRERESRCGPHRAPDSAGVERARTD
jgi:hypothetical protein